MYQYPLPTPTAAANGPLSSPHERSLQRAMNVLNIPTNHAIRDAHYLAGVSNSTSFPSCTYGHAELVGCAATSAFSMLGSETECTMPAAALLSRAAAVCSVVFTASAAANSPKERRTRRHMTTMRIATPATPCSRYESSEAQ